MGQHQAPGYATYRTLANLDVSIESLFPVQLGLGPVPIASTPHLSFVKAHLGHQGEVWSKDGWKDYMINESSSPPGSVEPRQERFERLIDHISDNPNDVHLLVALNPRLRGFEIVDDFLERQSWRLVGLDRLCRAAWSVISLHKQGRASLGGSFRSQALQPHVSVQQ